MDSGIYDCPRVWGDLLPEGVWQLREPEALAERVWSLLALTAEGCRRLEGTGPLCRILLAPGDCPPALLAGADEYLRSLGIPAVTTVPAERSLHDFFGANGFRECFRILGGTLWCEEIPVPPSNVLRPASPAEYGRVREELLKDIPHIAYPEDALAYQAGCCALGDGGLFVGDTPAGPVCLCAERADDELVIVKELLGPAGMGRAVFPDLPRIAPARRWEIRGPRPWDERPDLRGKLGKFAMLKWLDPALEKSWDWDTVGYLGLAFD